MAVPKRRTSKSRKLKRRNHHKATTMAYQACERCGDLRRPHRVCFNCGHYAGKQRIEVEDA